MHQKQQQFRFEQFETKNKVVIQILEALIQRTSTYLG